MSNTGYAPQGPMATPVRTGVPYVVDPQGDRGVLPTSMQPMGLGPASGMQSIIQDLGIFGNPGKVPQ